MITENTCKLQWDFFGLGRKRRLWQGTSSRGPRTRPPSPNPPPIADRRERSREQPHSEEHNSMITAFQIFICSEKFSFNMEQFAEALSWKDRQFPASLAAKLGNGLNLGDETSPSPASPTTPFKKLSVATTPPFHRGTER